MSHVFSHSVVKDTSVLKMVEGLGNGWRLRSERTWKSVVWRGVSWDLPFHIKSNSLDIYTRGSLSCPKMQNAWIPCRTEIIEVVPFESISLCFPCFCTCSIFLRPWLLYVCLVSQPNWSNFLLRQLKQMLEKNPLTGPGDRSLHPWSIIRCNSVDCGFTAPYVFYVNPRSELKGLILRYSGWRNIFFILRKW